MLDAAKAMKLSAKDLLNLEIIDEIILEPTGGAHRDKDLILENVKNSLIKNLEYFKTLSKSEIFNERKNKFLKIGRGKGFMTNPEDLSSLQIQERNFDKIFKSKKIIISAIISVVLIISLYLAL
jgi:acetyl-CoA carboxylase carboxyl transferase subunit alpha